LLLRRLTYRVRQALLAVGLLEDSPLDHRAWLAGDLATLFERQSTVDQRHARRVARTLLREGACDPEVIQAALLHDVGKCVAPIHLADRVTWVVLRRAPRSVRRLCLRWSLALRTLDGHAIVGARLVAAAGGSKRLANLIAGTGDDPALGRLRSADDSV